MEAVSSWRLSRTRSMTSPQARHPGQHRAEWARFRKEAAVLLAALTGFLIGSLIEDRHRWCADLRPNSTRAEKDETALHLEMNTQRARPRGTPRRALLTEAKAANF